MRSFDGDRLLEQLEAADRISRTVFAAACAERMWPLVERYAGAVSLPGNELARLRQALDSSWNVCAGKAADMTAAQDVAESMIPDEDAEWAIDFESAQNGVIAIVYAARTWLTNDPGEAFSAALQVYEAADSAALRRLLPDGEGIVTRAVHDQLQLSPIVAAAVDGIHEDIEAMRWQRAMEVREVVRARALEFIKLFPQDQ